VTGTEIFGAAQQQEFSNMTKRMIGLPAIFTTLKIRLRLPPTTYLRILLWRTHSEMASGSPDMAASIFWIRKSKRFFNYRNNPQHLPIFDSTFIYPLFIDQQRKLWYIRRPESVMRCYDLATHVITSTTLATDDTEKRLLTDVETIFYRCKATAMAEHLYYPLFFKERNSRIYHRFSHDDRVNFSINSDFFWDAMEDSDGTMWFGGLNGISKLQPSQQYYYLLKPNSVLPAALQFQ
jgi:hypothetical protein